MKNFVRFILYLLACPFVFPLGLLSFLEKHLSKSEFFFHIGAHTVAVLPGVIGNFFRGMYYMMTIEHFHPTAVISFGSFFSKREASIRARAGIGAFCIIGMSDIDEGVRLASRVSITSGLNEHGDSSNIVTKSENGGSVKKIRIGKLTWIGEGATISASVGDNCIVGVGAVVTNDVPDNNMAMGNPARLLPTAKAK